MRESVLATTLAVFGLIPLCGWAAEAAPPLGVSLMRPDSLAGWEYGAEPPAGWTIAGGELRARAGATPLLSGFTFGEFRLRFAWSVERPGAWLISMPEVPSGPGLRLVLCEGDGCGWLDDGGKLLAPGGRLPATACGTHETQLDRAGDILALTIDGKRLWQVTIRRGRRFGLGLAATGPAARLAGLRVEEPAGKPIFNGKNLAGWWTPGDLSAWAAENGQIVLRKSNGNYLRTEKEYANYTLSLDYRIQKGGNSGVGIRTPRLGWPSGDGMEIQIWDLAYNTPLDKHAAGAIYGNMPPLARADRSGEFNHMVIKADGRMISVWMNGELVQQCHSGMHPELKHRRLQGWIGIQDHNARIEVRNLRVLEAPPGLGLSAWQEPGRKSAAAMVIDRLMNPERLSVADGVRSHVATARVDGEKKGRHVLAELPGPGALVRMARTSDEGLLAFYFDGESQPRLTCKPADLWQAGPQLAEDSNPVLTCLAFRKGLKVVLSDANRGNWQIDYLSFPADVGVESLAAKDARIPRGWLPAAIYRHEQFGWGVHREYDPRPRVVGGPKTIAPGKRERLIRVDGAGILHWIKLTGDKGVLANNDLWLEARVDGQSEPAVATPVRSWFPGLAGEGNYPNYVLVDRDGPTNMLAMPFGDGIELALANHGTRPIAGVGLTVSMERATAATRADIQKRMRLHAVFEPADQAVRDLVRCQGRGRLVGLVYEEPKGAGTALQSLVVDGELAHGWNAPTLDAFLGRSGDFRSCLSGRHGPLAWRYLLVEPIDFQKSLRLGAGGTRLGSRLAIFYAYKSCVSRETAIARIRLSSGNE